jgi:hypothetical protein
MAIIPNDEKLMIIDNNTDTRYTGSTMLQDRQKYYTIQDLKDTVAADGGGSGGGGGIGVAPFTIEKDGTLGSWGNYANISYSIAGFIPNSSGNQTITPRIVPNLSVGSNSTFTFLNFVDIDLANIYISNCQNLQSLTFPDLTTIVNGGMGACFVSYNQALTTVSFPVLANVDSFSDVRFTNNALTQASVDHILVKIAGSGSIGGMLDFTGGTNAAPSAAGLAAKATLLGRGWTVSHN